MKKSLYLRLTGIILLALVVTFFNLPYQKQKQVISYLPESFQKINIHLGLDLQGGTQLDYKIDLRQVPADRQDQIIEGVKNTINRRVNNLGVSEPNIYISQVGDEKHIIVELAGIKDIEEAKATVGKTIQLEFKEEKRELDPNEKEKIQTQSQNILDKIKKGAEFVVTAREEEQASPGKVKFSEGKDFYFADQISTKARDILFKLKVGEITPNLVETTKEDNEYGLNEKGQLAISTGYNIYQVIDRKDNVEREIEKQKEVKVRHILVSYKGLESADASLTRTEDEAKKRAEEVVQKLKNGEDFSKLAKEYSDDKSNADKGGVLDEPAKDGANYVPDFTNAALKLEKIGDLSEITKTQFGFHIIKADAVTPASKEKKQESQIKYHQLFISTAPDEWKSTSLTGKNFKKADVQFNQTYQPYVSIEFDPEGAKLFEDITGRNVGKQVAIFVGGQLISAPRVNEKISGGNAQISGSFTLDEASSLARDLNTGAIPAPVLLTGQYTIGASLGQDALNQSVRAGMIGFLIVALFMILYYGLAGILATVALSIYTTLLLFIIKGALPFGVAIGLSILIFLVVVGKIIKSDESGLEKMVSFLIACFILFFLSFVFSSPIVLTLAGIAGIVLSIGMAVDANILIFERIKEELKNTASLPLAVEKGFSRAWPSIRDSNFSTLITCAILMYFGTSIIRGFAFNLSLGVLVSMFSAIAITKTFFQLIATSKLANSRYLLSIFPKKTERKPWQVIKNTKKWLLFSGVLIIIPIIAIIMFGLKLGLDFTGGTLLELKFNQDVTVNQIQEALKNTESAMVEANKKAPTTPETDSERLEPDLGTPVIVSSGEKKFLLRLKPINNNTHNFLIKEIKTKFPDTEETRYNIIGPTVGQTLKINSLEALAVALIMIIFYIAFAFREIPKRINPWRFGACAVLALVHDVFITFGLYVLISEFVPIEVDTLLITALLTTLGFSVHDTIVVFDRIREHLKYQKRDETFEQVADKALNQTITRSINTSLTALLAILALFFFGAESIKYFVLTLIIGIAIGTYSSIFVASPLLVAWWKWKKNN